MAARSRRGDRRRRDAVVAAVVLLAAGPGASVGTAHAHAPVPVSLREVEVPRVPGLLSGRTPIVRDRRAAIVLGKALFWDVQLGSDGMACASCHHHAGADGRITNQLAPGRTSGTRPTSATFEPLASGAAGGPNHTLRRADFPLHQLVDPDDFGSAVAFTTDDVVGSGGAIAGTFRGAADPASPHDECAPLADAVFHLGGAATRQVTSRNAPSVINAAFNRRSFWDGRANERFNGVDPYGDRNPDAGVWLWRDGRLRRKRLRLANASLASQAVSPPLDSMEMSCAGRTFPDVGRKLLPRRALRFQAVHPQDGVLGRRRHRSGDGLDVTYASLVRAAFDRRYWAAPRAKTGRAFGAPAGGGRPYTQMEANFAFFLGLALQLYQATLVSDAAPFDGPRDADGVPSALGPEQRRGLAAFSELHCADCHGGPTFSGGAAVAAASAATDVDRKPVRSVAGGMVLGLVDAGFVNTGVVPLADDPGVGGRDPFGIPLSFAEQYVGVLAGGAERAVDAISVRACAMTAPFATASFGHAAFAPGELVADPAGSDGCGAPRWAAVPAPDVVVRELAQPDDGRLPLGVTGAFKVPSLRNVELTGPYMHDGGMATLEEVIAFYARGGNHASPGKDAQFLFGPGVLESTRADLVAFLVSLTDERVRWERAPFDHPALRIPEGHDPPPPGAAAAPTRFVELPAVGASGRDAALGPLRSFAERLAP